MAITRTGTNTTTMEQSVNQQNEGIYVEDLRLIHLKEEKLSQQFSIYPKLLIYVGEEVKAAQEKKKRILSTNQDWSSTLSLDVSPEEEQPPLRKNAPTVATLAEGNGGNLPHVRYTHRRKPSGGLLFLFIYSNQASPKPSNLTIQDLTKALAFTRRVSNPCVSKGRGTLFSFNTRHFGRSLTFVEVFGWAAATPVRATILLPTLFGS
ncbi:hypothetical protein JHK85_004587 [Glycine max]|nr:hypothetical protein JHK85_004587 [Glycine max]